jgi:hypothetical protein
VEDFPDSVFNIAGLWQIFGAVAGAMWGPVAFLWIALGSVLQVDQTAEGTRANKEGCRFVQI